MSKGNGPRLVGEEEQTQSKRERPKGEIGKPDESPRRWWLAEKGRWETKVRRAGLYTEL
jgi:hypothetical protein